MIVVMKIASVVIAEICLMLLRRGMCPGKKGEPKNKEPLGGLLFGNLYYWRRANRAVTTKH